LFFKIKITGMIACGKIAPFRQTLIAKTADGPGDIMVDCSAVGLGFAVGEAR
jgi:hypothetical protein